MKTGSFALPLALGGMVTLGASGCGDAPVEPLAPEAPRETDLRAALETARHGSSLAMGCGDLVPVCFSSTDGGTCVRTTFATQECAPDDPQSVTFWPCAEDVEDARDDAVVRADFEGRLVRGHGSLVIRGTLRTEDGEALDIWIESKAGACELLPGS